VRPFLQFFSVGRAEAGVAEVSSQRVSAHRGNCACRTAEFPPDIPLTLHQGDDAI